MAIQLRCVDKDLKDEKWTLELNDDQVVVRDASGKPAAQFPAAETASRFQMPSFSENVKYFGVVIGDQYRRFDVSKEGLKEIRGYKNQLTAAAGPEAVRAVRNKAIRDALIGVGCAIGGVVLTMEGYRAAAQKPEGGEFKIAYGLVLFGLVMLGKGVYGYLQYSQIQRLSA